MNSIKHIIWDWNGTLFDDVDLCVDIINRILENRNLKPLTRDIYRDIFTFPVKEYYKKAGIELKKYSFEELGKEWMDQYELRKAECSLFSNAASVVEKIYSKNIKQSILSAYKQDTLVHIVNKHGLINYFSNIIGLNHIYADSKIELGISLLEKIKLKPDEILFIGDTVHDHETALKMGVNSILISFGHQSREKLLPCGVPVLENMRDVMNYLNLNPK